MINATIKNESGMTAESTNTYTAIIIEDDGVFIGYVPEVPGVNCQADSMDEMCENLKEALAMILEANRELSKKQLDEEHIPASKIFQREIHVSIPAFAIAG